MKKLFLVLFIVSFLFLFPVAQTHAQMMGQSTPISSADIQQQQNEQNEGKNFLNQLKSGKVTCQKLTSDNFEKIGEYAMYTMVGNTQSHIYMNNMITTMMGQQGEVNVHTALGKRYSLCDPNAAMPGGMMNMMGNFNQGFSNERQGGDTYMMGGNYGGNMMGWGGMLFGGIFMILFGVLLILGVIALFTWIRNAGKGQNGTKSLDILKERYAKGDITKKEFEEKKKDID